MTKNSVGIASESIWRGLLWVGTGLTPCPRTPLLPPIQFLLYIDLGGTGTPVDMETDCPPLDDVALLKKTMEDEAIQVARLRRTPM